MKRWFYFEYDLLLLLLTILLHIYHPKRVLFHSVYFSYRIHLLGNFHCSWRTVETDKRKKKFKMFTCVTRTLRNTFRQVESIPDYLQIVCNAHRLYLCLMIGRIRVFAKKKSLALPQYRFQLYFTYKENCIKSNP